MCQQARFADPDGFSALVRSFRALGQPRRADVQTVELSRSEQEAARAFRASWLLSSDAGHLVHPNQPEKHDPTNRPRPGAGPLLKISANQRYMTEAKGEAVWAAACETAGVPWQPFVNVNTIPGGSTIGPIAATRLGIPTIDIGVGLLSMHSIRELVHVDDLAALHGAVAAFLAG